MPPTPDTSLDALGWLTPFVVFIVPYLLKRFAPTLFEMFMNRLERQAREERDADPTPTMRDASSHAALLAAHAAESKRTDALERSQSELRNEWRDTFRDYRLEFNKLFDELGEKVRIRLDSDHLNNSRNFRGIKERQDTFEERLTHAEKEIAELKAEWKERGAQ